MNTKPVPWKMVGVLCATATASYMCRVNVSTAGAMMMKEFHLDQEAMGWIFTAFLIGYALFQIPAGALADRWGTRKTLTLAAWLWVILSVGQTLCGTLIGTTASAAVMAFMVSRMLLGIAESPTFPGSARGVSRWIPQQFQARANGIVIGAVGLGSALTPVLVSAVMVRAGWRASLIVSAIPALVVAILWMRVKEPAPIAETTPTASEQSSVPNGKLTSLRFMCLTISYTLQGYVGYIFVSWFYLYLVQERHFGLVSGAFMSSLPWILSIVSIPLGGLVADRLCAGKLGPIWGMRIVPIIGMAGSGILISVGAHTQDAYVAAISLALATALVLCVEGPFWAMMMRIAGGRSGTAGGVMNMGSNLGGLISPALTPILAKHIGWENALHISAFLAVIAAILWLGVRPEGSANAAGPQHVDRAELV